MTNDICYLFLPLFTFRVFGVVCTFVMVASLYTAEGPLRPSLQPSILEGVLPCPPLQSSSREGVLPRPLSWMLPATSCACWLWCWAQIHGRCMAGASLCSVSSNWGKWVGAVGVNPRAATLDTPSSGARVGLRSWRAIKGISLTATSVSRCCCSSSGHVERQSSPAHSAPLSRPRTVALRPTTKHARLAVSNPASSRGRFGQGSSAAALSRLLRLGRATPTMDLHTQHYSIAWCVGGHASD